jgi:AraC family transcriptional regulator
VVAAEVGVHRVHLAREFRKYNGLTVGEDLRRVRVTFACQQFLNTRDPPAKIACAAGFTIRIISFAYLSEYSTTPGRFPASHTRPIPR